VKAGGVYSIVLKGYISLYHLGLPEAWTKDLSFGRRK